MEVYLNISQSVKVYGRWYGAASDGLLVPVIVLLHEGLGCVAMWKDFPQKLHRATKMPVFAYDRPGYGLSDDLPDEFTEGFLEREADVHLPAILKEAGITGRIMLVGHSDGATASLMASAHNALQVIGVVAMAPHVIIEPISIEGLLTTRSLAAESDLLARLSKYHGERTSRLVLMWLNAWLSPWTRHWQMDDYLKRIECPVSFIQGVDDHFGTEAQAHHIIKLVGGPVFVKMIDNCGHTPHLQFPDVVVSEITRFTAACMRFYWC